MNYTPLFCLVLGMWVSLLEACIYHTKKAKELNPCHVYYISTPLSEEMKHSRILILFPESGYERHKILVCEEEK